MTRFTFGVHVLAATLLLLLSAPPVAAQTLTLGKPDDLISGLSAHILQEAYRSIDIDVTITELPVERSLIQADKGKTDGEVNRIKDIEKNYPNLVMVPTPVNVNEAMVFSGNQDFEVTGWESLEPYTIAIRIGVKFVEKGTRGMKVFRFVTNEKVFTLVARGRYDLCIASRLTGMYEIQRQKLTGIKTLEPPLVKLDLYHYLHNKHQELVPRIDRVLKEMHQNGRMDAIREQFIREMLASYPASGQRN